MYNHRLSEHLTALEDCIIKVLRIDHYSVLVYANTCRFVARLNDHLYTGAWSDNRAYSMFYIDADGKSKRVKQFIGNLDQMSERAARREHARILEDVNRRRGSVAPVYKGQTFREVTELWRRAVGPNLSPSTVRQRESYLKTHVMTRFGDVGVSSLGVQEFQQFAADLRKTVSRKTVLNILGTMFTILDYAGRCGIGVRPVRFRDLELGSDARGSSVPFFTREQASRLVAEA